MLVEWNQTIFKFCIGPIILSVLFLTPCIEEHRPSITTKFSVLLVVYVLHKEMS